MSEKAFVSEVTLFTNGGSQAVRLPAECRFSSEKVLIQKFGEHVIISPKSKNWDAFFERPWQRDQDFIQRGDQGEHEDRAPFE